MTDWPGSPKKLGETTVNADEMLSALAIANEISTGRLSPNEVFEHSAKRIADLEETVRAFSHIPEQLHAGLGPLRGIQVGVKDIFDTHDMPTSYGSAIYPDHRPVADAALVAMLRQAGATIAGKTVTTEFAWFSPGDTTNPHNSGHTPGGSSSGSAAGVAAGFFPAAIGSQTGGSIIRPAAFCGVAGYKPSFRLFPTIGMKQFSWSLDTVGFFGATVADAAFVAAACSGRNLQPSANPGKPPRIGLYRSAIDAKMNKDMAKTLDKVAHIAAEAGATIVTIKEPKALESGRLAHATIQDFEAALALCDERHRFPDLLSPVLAKYLEGCIVHTPQDYDKARRAANRARKASRALFDNCDVLLLPSAPGAASKTLKSTGDSVFNRLWTLLGMPCVNVAGMKSTSGLPLGVQIIAPFGQDKKALQAAHWLEKKIQSTRTKSPFV